MSTSTTMTGFLIVAALFAPALLLLVYKIVKDSPGCCDYCLSPDDAVHQLDADLRRFDNLDQSPYTVESFVKDGDSASLVWRYDNGSESDSDQLFIHLDPDTLEVSVGMGDAWAYVEEAFGDYPLTPRWAQWFLANSDTLTITPAK